jgi:hypothetical protein
VTFKLFLHYARTGRLTITKEDEEEQVQRVFEEEVAAALRARGYELHTRVGIAGLFVDIAVFKQGWIDATWAAPYSRLMSSRRGLKS